jgi:hypothetical protein
MIYQFCLASESWHWVVSRLKFNELTVKKLELKGEEKLLTDSEF